MNPMNTNPDAIRILCFGDSNTKGSLPIVSDRWPANVRWTGVLQNMLGDKFEIIEEGQSARTTDIDDPKHIGRNGLAYFLPCLESQGKLDFIVLFLGTNDLKERYHREPEETAKSIKKYIDTINTFYEINRPRIIIVCPTIVNEFTPWSKEKYVGAYEKSKKLPTLYQQIAEENNCGFVNLQDSVEPCKEDGGHLDQEAHKKVAKLIYKVKGGLRETK